MQLQGKKYGVFGLGVSGTSALKFLLKEGAKVVVVNQGAPESWPETKTYPTAQFISQDNPKAAELLAACECIVLSPGIPRTHDVLLLAHSNGVPVISEIELAFRYINSGTYLSITGSNGKTTTVTLLAKSLEALGQKVFLGGNIGTPLCELAFSQEEVDFIVLELSSFQLESMIHFKTHISAIINLTMNHGERYNEFEDYARAKFHITDRQVAIDHFVYDSSAEFLGEWTKNFNITKHPLELHDRDVLTSEISAEYDLSQLLLPGDHNLANIRVVQEFINILGLSHSGLQKVINTFPGVYHRVEFVNHSGPFVCYNDAKSTNWDATIAAVKAMYNKPKPLWLILGGKPRGGGEVPSQEVLEYIRDNVEMALAIGDAQSFVQKELSNDVKVFLAQDLAGVKEKLIKEKFKGTLLFSPAFPSFDQFKNYVDRGDQFKKMITEIDWSKL